jgi:hypothetical protein
MPSIVGERYNNATGWTVTDKIFGYMDQAGNLYNKVRYPQYYNDPAYAAQLAALQAQRGMFGLPSPLGFLLLAGSIGLVGFVAYKIVNK